MEFSNWDETSCSLLCQHPCCWSSVNRIERNVPRKATSIGKLDAVNYDSCRDEEDNKEKRDGNGRKGDNVFDGGVLITGPTVCDLFKSFPVCLEPLSTLDTNSEKRQNKYGFYTDIDSQESLRFDIPKCPPGSEEKVSIESFKENKVPCVHIVQGFIINEDSNRISKPQYIWIPAKKKETKENVLSAEQRPSTQIFEASEVLEYDKQQRKKSVTDVLLVELGNLLFNYDKKVPKFEKKHLKKAGGHISRNIICDDWSTWMLSSKFRYKTNKCRYRSIAGIERQKTISSDFEFKPCSEHLVGKKAVKGNILQTRGLSSDSGIFWKPTSVLGSATTKKYPINLESSHSSSPDDFLYNGPYDGQKQSKIEFGTKNNESVKISSFEVSHGKLATISLELRSKDKYPITQSMNYQKKRLDFPLVPLSSSNANLSPHLKEEEKEEPNKRHEECRTEESKDNLGIICGYKHENTIVAKERRQKERLENVTKCKHQVTRRVSFTENVHTFDPQDSCYIEAMPLHRVRIANTPTMTTLIRRQPPIGSGKKTRGRISSKRRSAAAMTRRQGVRSSPPNEQLEAIITVQKAGTGESMKKVDFTDLPKPPPPSPQMLSNFNGGSSPHHLFDESRLETVLLLEKPKTVPSLEPVENGKR